MYDYLEELNTEQRAAVEHGGSPLLIMAGAGSGKTKTLTYKAAYLIHTKVITPDQLLMVTFTNKAAGEMIVLIEGARGDHHVGALGRKPLGDRRADTSTCPGDNDIASVEAAHGRTPCPEPTPMSP